VLHAGQARLRKPTACGRPGFTWHTDAGVAGEGFNKVCLAVLWRRRVQLTTRSTTTSTVNPPYMWMYRRERNTNPRMRHPIHRCRPVHQTADLMFSFVCSVCVCITPLRTRENTCFDGKFGKNSWKLMQFLHELLVMLVFHTYTYTRISSILVNSLEY